MPRRPLAPADASARVAALLAAHDPQVLGDRLRRHRLQQGLSVRDLGTRAGVSKNSVVRLEQGKGSHAATVVRVCTALGLHVDRLAEGSDPTSAVAHRHADDRWYDLADFGAGPLLGLDRPLHAVERAEAVAAGAHVPLCLLKSRLPEGRVLPTLLELYAPSEWRSHPGEEFVYVLEGRVQVDVGAASFELDAGESLTFFSAEPHRYAPAATSRPARLLSVRIDG